MDGARLNGHKEKMSQHNTVLRGLTPAFMGSEAVFQADALYWAIRSLTSE